jgi:thiosulfate/3-mercaptopyruvate sulfurtransferase
MLTAGRCYNDSRMDVDADQLNARLGEVVLLDVRNEGEFTGATGYPCDARQGHIPTARHLELGRLIEAGSVEAIRELVGEPEGTEIVAYCHSGSRSAMAVQVLLAAGYEARNYVGSWHDWSSRAELPVE